MKKILSILILVATHMVCKSQLQLCGTYLTNSYYNHTLKQRLDLNCEKTFVLTDSTFNMQIKGTWNTNEKNEVVLMGDTLISEGKVSAKKIKITFAIKGNELHNTAKIQSERKYKRENRRICREITRSSGERMEALDMEPYEDYKKRQENSYFRKVNDMSQEQ